MTQQERKKYEKQFKLEAIKMVDGMRVSKKNSHVVCQAAGLKFQCIKDTGDSYPVALMCRALKVTTSGYYSCLGLKPAGR